MPITSDDRVRQLKADLRRVIAVAVTNDRLMRELSQPSGEPFPPNYIAWHRRAWWAIRWYLANLWDALRGRGTTDDGYDDY